MHVLDLLRMTMRQRHEPPAEREPSSGSGVKRSSAEDEATRRADAEAEKALKRARVMKEQRAAKCASVARVGRINGH